MSLKKTLDRLVAEADAKAEAKRKADLEDERRSEAADRLKAEKVVQHIPERAEELLAAGLNNLSLWTGDEVGHSLDQLRGVAEQIRLILSREGLGDRVWVDVDTSGKFVCLNDLKLRLRDMPPTVARPQIERGGEP